MGREALIVLTVVSGRCLSAYSPDTQDVDTSTALSTRLRWSDRDPCERHGDRNTAVRAVALTRIQ